MCRPGHARMPFWPRAVCCGNPLRLSIARARQVGYINSHVSDSRMTHPGAVIAGALCFHGVVTLSPTRGLTTHCHLSKMSASPISSTCERRVMTLPSSPFHTSGIEVCLVSVKASSSLAGLVLSNQCCSLCVGSKQDHVPLLHVTVSQAFVQCALADVRAVVTAPLCKVVAQNKP